MSRFYIKSLAPPIGDVGAGLDRYLLVILGIGGEGGVQNSCFRFHVPASCCEEQERQPDMCLYQRSNEWNVKEWMKA